MTKSQEAWWKDFKAVLRRTPKDFEICVSPGGCFSLLPAGSRASYFAEHGDTDGVDSLELASTKCDKFWPMTECT